MTDYIFPNLPTAEFAVGDRIIFNYTGSPQVFNRLDWGAIKIECWGAQGGKACYINSAYAEDGIRYPASRTWGNYTGGKGGYAYGTLHNINAPIYVHVGGMPTGNESYDDHNYFSTQRYGGWNGGADGGTHTSAYTSGVRYYSGGGGGASDVRLIAYSDSSSTSIRQSNNSRIIIAPGGGGASYSDGRGGNGGGYVSENVVVMDSDNTECITYGVGQGENSSAEWGYGSSGYGGGGGGGFLGGYAGTSMYYGDDAAGTGGSAYISGDLNCPFQNPQGVKLYNTGTIAGSFEGHNGNGVVIFTIIESLFYRKLKIDNILKSYDNGWCKIDNSIGQIDFMWTKVDGVLRKI